MPEQNINSDLIRGHIDTIILKILQDGDNSDIWFGRPFSISGPYQMANIVSRFYLPLLTVIVPITFSNFTSLLLNSRNEYENE